MTAAGCFAGAGTAVNLNDASAGQSVDGVPPWTRLKSRLAKPAKPTARMLGAPVVNTTSCRRTVPAVGPPNAGTGRRRRSAQGGVVGGGTLWPTQFQIGGVIGGKVVWLG
jgi:hypothetical protein